MVRAQERSGSACSRASPATEPSQLPCGQPAAQGEGLGLQTRALGAVPGRRLMPALEGHSRGGTCLSPGAPRCGPGVMARCTEGVGGWSWARGEGLRSGAQPGVVWPPESWLGTAGGAGPAGQAMGPGRPWAWGPTRPRVSLPKAAGYRWHGDCNPAGLDLWRTARSGLLPVSPPTRPASPSPSCPCCAAGCWGATASPCSLHPRALGLHLAWPRDPQSKNAGLG